jgi:hypothetical protein
MPNDKPKLELVGADGNAFNVLGLARRAARKAEWPQEKIDAFLKEAMAGNYDNLLATCMKHFDVS